MKMAKASEHDLSMAMELANALESLNARWYPTMPEKIEQLEGDEEGERFDLDDAKQCRRVCEYLIQLTERASLSRVVMGMMVLLDPANKMVDPAATTLEHHPERNAMEAVVEAVRKHHVALGMMGPGDHSETVLIRQIEAALDGAAIPFRSSADGATLKPAARTLTRAARPEVDRLRETLETVRAILKIDDPHGLYDLVCDALAPTAATA